MGDHSAVAKGVDHPFLVAKDLGAQISSPLCFMHTSFPDFAPFFVHESPAFFFDVMALLGC